MNLITPLLCRFVLSVGSFAMLAACAMEQTPVTPSSTAGYADGCASGRRDAGEPAAYARDEARARTDADYAKGWNQGYEICFTQLMERLHRKRGNDND